MRWIVKAPGRKRKADIRNQVGRLEIIAESTDEEVFLSVLSDAIREGDYRDLRGRFKRRYRTLLAERKLQL